MVEGGYVCSSCHKVMSEDEWAKESMGQCVACWESNPEPIPTSFDLETLKAIRDEDDSL